MTLPVALPPEAFSSPLHNRIFSSLIAVGVVGCFCIFAVVSWFSMERRRRQQQKRVAAISEVASSPTIAEMVEQGLVLQGISGRTGGRDSVVKWEAEHGEYK
jgi:flagellar biosynthesis/type III secretory pathway M-ring protein FliF/YscJ